MISDLIEIRAELKLYPSNEGGRKTGIASGYRPNHVFEYKADSDEFKGTYIGNVKFDNKELLVPGEIHEVRVRFLKHQNIEDFMQVGRVWWIHEAQNKIGEARIIEIEKI